MCPLGTGRRLRSGCHVGCPPGVGNPGCLLGQGRRNRFRAAGREIRCSRLRSRTHHTRVPAIVATHHSTGSERSRLAQRAKVHGTATAYDLRSVLQRQILNRPGQAVDGIVPVELPGFVLGRT
jgi:hypothetical protein